MLSVAAALWKTESDLLFFAAAVPTVIPLRNAGRGKLSVSTINKKWFCYDMIPLVPHSFLCFDDFFGTRRVGILKQKQKRAEIMCTNNMKMCSCGKWLLWIWFMIYRGYFCSVRGESVCQILKLFQVGEKGDFNTTIIPGAKCRNVGFQTWCDSALDQRLSNFFPSSTSKPTQRRPQIL